MLSFSEVVIKDKWDEEAVNYYDVWIYDLNLGAIMKRYQTAGWSDWFHWSNDSWICDELTERTHLASQASLADARTMVKKAWMSMVRKTHK